MTVSRRRFLGASAALAPFAALAPARAQSTYPSKPVRLVIGFTTGGTSNAVANAISEGVSRRLGQSLVIENLPGAGGVVGTSAVAKAPADGHVVGYTSNAFVTVTPHLMKVPYDPFVDIEPVALIGGSVNVLAVHPSLPVHSVAEFIDYARARPGELFYGSSGNATGNHISVEYLKRKTGIDAVHVPYKGMASALTDLVAGRLHFVVDPALVPYIQGGQVRALGVVDAERHPNPALAGLPPLSRAIAGWQPPRWYNLATVPRGTPQAVQARLASAFNDTLAEPAVIERLAQSSYLAGTPTAPAELRARLAREKTDMARLLADAGIALG